MISRNDIETAFIEHPWTAFFITVVVLFHIGILVYGFMILWKGESTTTTQGINNKNKFTSPSFSGKLKKLPGAEEELRKLVEKEIKQD